MLLVNLVQILHLVKYQVNKHHTENSVETNYENNMKMYKNLNNKNNKNKKMNKDQNLLNFKKIIKNIFKERDHFI